MKHVLKQIITILLTVSLLCSAVIPALAAKNEEYLSDLRIIYANDYEEAKQLLSETAFKDYTLLDANLNENTGKIGVWLAYQTTTDIEDAITDISVMQMKGGYREGNYQAMIKKSYDQYLAFGENYLVAIEYFAKAYEAGNYLAEVAYRQLNLYNVVTEGIEEIPDFEGERLGDIFLDDLQAADLATMFMEGNVYVLNNVRSLLALGVSYNEDGKTYLEKVAAEVEALNADPTRYENEDYNDLAAMIAPTISTFRTMFEELAAYESELNYEDETFTELEIKYAESMALARMMREVPYLNGKTLYEFCLAYDGDLTDFSSLYPLVAALNEGQEAMAKVVHYYDVVRYSVQLTQDQVMDEELTALEAKYGETPFNIYTGMDRTIFRDSFALTGAAYRADAYTESGLSAALFNSDYTGDIVAATMFGVIGAGITIAGLKLHWNIAKEYRATMDEYNSNYAYQFGSGQDIAKEATEKANFYMKYVYWMYAIGGLLMLSTALGYGMGVYNYYNPTYDDIPTAMVDMINTVDGDRYIKYDVVYEAVAQKDGNYAAADLNAFKGQRWNALYYTKSYEAGKPLLADEFVVSTTSNVPAKNYMPVHRFGEVVCFNLNKYNYNETQSIYLSVKQSENQKSAVADVPEVIGSMFGKGFWILAGGIGIIAGIGGTVATQGALKKNKRKSDQQQDQE